MSPLPVISFVKRDWHFDFVIENISQEGAEYVFSLAVKYADDNNSLWGGGCAPVDDIEAQKEIDELAAKQITEQNKEKDTCICITTMIKLFRLALAVPGSVLESDIIKAMENYHEQK